MRALKDSVVVITGASSGIGRAAALQFAERGAAVVVAARRAPALDELVRDLEAKEALCLAVPTDVTDAAEVEQLARRAIETFGRIDVWVNNAGVYAVGRLEETPVDVVRRVFETNVMGIVNGVRAALPYMREQGSGLVINVGSLESVVAAPYTSAYAASKHAVRGLTASLRQELAPDGIEVCAVLPGAVDTPLWDQAANFTGRAIKPPPPILDVREAAEAIVACAVEPEAEKLVGAASPLVTLLHALVPGVVEALARRHIEATHFLPHHAAATEGNLFEPMPAKTSAAGGWRTRPSLTWTTVGSVAAALAPAALAVLAYGLIRPERPKARALAELGV